MLQMLNISKIAICLGRRQKSKKIADETVNEISIENEESDTNGLIPILIDVSSDELRFTLLKSAVFHSIKSGNIY